MEKQSIYIGKSPQRKNTRDSGIDGSFIMLGNEEYNMISDVDKIDPFFMSIVSDSNHWMFISSNGALTAGRKNNDYSLFPYYTDDKITESVEMTGSKTVFLVEHDNKSVLWEPFSDRYEGVYSIKRNIYKGVCGNKIVFEEINYDLGLSFKYQWNTSSKFGFVRQAVLSNMTANDITVSLVDGIQNVLPYGVNADLQNSTSNLVDAYKRSELIEESGLGIFALSAIIVDKAEPSEALKANIAWSLGLEQVTYLLSTNQLRNFRMGGELVQEVEVKGGKGSYFVHASLNLRANGEKKWLIVANVNQTQSSVVRISESILKDKTLYDEIIKDIYVGEKNLKQLVASADGLQLTADKLRNTRHFSNTLFNIMRGGIFDKNYKIEKRDFCNYLSKANRMVFRSHKSIIDQLPSEFDFNTLEQIADSSGDAALRRLCIEYMPLKFSRRHGDPSRPWNRFSINTSSEIDGSKILDYEGNWRDIFQNWEALSLSYPLFVRSMIYKFLNASTFDGYNPYRITKDGVDWEVIEPDNPWSYIGYWGDHQIIYLLKLLEQLEKYEPGQLRKLFVDDVFVYVNVPYKIKSYTEILENPKDTITFDSKLDLTVQKKRQKNGADGTLLEDQNGVIYTVNFIEKILVTVLAKLSNFVPEGGIWMNTQRPEWNDANNALVGNGVSMVTLCQLYRFLVFFKGIFDKTDLQRVELSTELVELFGRIFSALEANKQLLETKINDVDRKRILDALGHAGSDYRTKIYNQAFSGLKQSVSMTDLKQFVEISICYLEHSIRANKRSDNLYHSYNILTVKNTEASISYLSEMLEGQVAVLSSGELKVTDVLDLLDSLKNSQLYRKDQNSYILYPNKNLPRFLEKNNIPAVLVDKSDLLKSLLKENDLRIIEKDCKGNYHFNCNFKNVNDLKAALKELSQSKFWPLVEKEEELLCRIYEEVFNHKAFTGRSGTFYGYEGLGSIYWHMVSKLQLAVQECCQKEIAGGADHKSVAKLVEHYYDVVDGIGVHKSPALYGAFTTDPYSHTPEGKGAKQPGMTGQVKEDIISRFGELGVSVCDGKLAFRPSMLRKNEFLTEEQSFDYVDVNAQPSTIALNKDSLAFTYCQVPVVYRLSDNANVELQMRDGSLLKFESGEIDEIVSASIFGREDTVVRIDVNLNMG
jgi:hypothetical protein